MTPPVKHTGPSVSEQALFDTWDLVDAARLRGGEREAARIAKRALYAAQGDDEMSTYVNQVDAIFKAANPDAIVAGLRVLRDAAEQEGDFDAADEYTNAIQSIMAANGTTPAAPAAAIPADDTVLSRNDDEPADALAMSKAIHKGQQGFLQSYKQVNGDDIRKRPNALAADFAQSPPRAAPVAPMAPAPDTLKLAKLQRERDETSFKSAVAAQIRKSIKR